MSLFRNGYYIIFLQNLLNRDSTVLGSFINISQSQMCSELPNNKLLD
jgi:hypothetical protein